MVCKKGKKKGGCKSGKKRLNIWKIDTTPTVYNYQIPFEKVTT